ncbi:MAG: hypothetical protein ACKVE4_09815 [Dissulfuribacterales bacterium]
MAKKTPGKSTTKKKAAAQKKTAPGKKAALKKSAAAKTAPKKTAAKKKSTTKPTLKSLLKKNFGTWIPENISSVPSDESYLKDFTAPPAIDETDKAAAKKIHALVAKQFDLSIFDKKTKTDKPKKPAIKKETPKKSKKKEPVKKPTEKKETAKTPAIKEPAKKTTEKPVAPSKKKAVSIPELLQLKFESWQPEKLLTVAADETYKQGFTAPPAVDMTDKNNAARIKALLSKTFDLTVPDVKEAPVPETTETPAPEEKPEEKIVEKAKAEEAIPEPEAPPVEPVKEKIKVEPEPEKPEASSDEPVKEEVPAEPQPEKPAVEPEKKPEEPAAEAVKEETKKKPEPVKAEEKKAPAKAAPKLPTPAKPAPVQPTRKETVPSMPPAPAAAMEKPEPENQALKMLIGCIAGIFALLIIASAMNTNNYYLKPTKNALEIWKGNFSPNGKELIMSVPGATIPEPVKSEYNRAEALLFAFNYYIAKADAVAGEKTIKGYDAALKHLKQAAGLHIDRTRKEQISKKINAIKTARDKLIKKTKIKP